MKKRFLFLFSSVIFLLMGCPVGLEYSLGNPGKEKIDKDLLGTWRGDSEEGEVRRVKMEAGEDNSLKVTVLERGEMYSLETDNLTGWVTTVDTKKFLYFTPEGEGKGTYYHYCYWMDGDSVVSTSMSLLDGGVEAITSTETLRMQVVASMKMEGWGEETVKWSKD